MRKCSKCDKPVQPPSKVLCIDHLRQLDNQFRDLAKSMGLADDWPAPGEQPDPTVEG